MRSPWRIPRPSEAVLFRMIDRDHPTVMLDEVDAIFGDGAFDLFVDTGVTPPR